MKKTFSGIIFILLLTGCAESIALLSGPAASGIGGGNIMQSSITTVTSYSIKKRTGKSPLEHITAYAEKNNPTRKKEKCVVFLEASSSEVCAIAKKKVAEIKSKIRIRSSIKDLEKKSITVNR